MRQERRQGNARQLKESEEDKQARQNKAVKGKREKTDSMEGMFWADFQEGEGEGEGGYALRLRSTDQDDS